MTTLSEGLINRIAAIMGRALDRHGGAPLDRLQRGFLAVVGATEPQRAPLQKAPFIFPDLTARAWHPPDALGDACAKLEASYAAIREEAIAALDSAKPWLEQHLLSSGQWDSITVKRGAEFPHRASCPTTTSTIERLPFIGSEGMFSVLRAGTHIRPHAGNWNCRLTIHLPLVVPDGCGIRVGSETRHWEEGRALVFDDSFEHEAWNRGSSHRVVLLLDMWHPELSAVEVEVLSEIGSAFQEDFIERSQRGNETSSKPA